VDETKNAEGADVIAVTAPVMPNAADYADTKAGRKSYNLDMKKWDNAMWDYTHPKVAKSGPAKVYTLADIHDTARATIAKKVAGGMTEKEATISVLAASAKSYREYLRRFEDMLVLARAL
jgi:hypothetical protein